jgi:hypothetical protein
MRQELPWVRVDKSYRFETDEGKASLSDLFRGRSQLLIYHLMFGLDYTAAVPPARQSRTGSMASGFIWPTTTLCSGRCRERRSPSSRGTSGGWAGPSRGPRHSAAISTFNRDS